MLKGLRNIIKKEIKDLLRDPKILFGMILMPIIIFPVMGLMMGFSMKTAVETAKSARIAIWDSDGGAEAKNLIEYLRNINPNIVILNSSSLNESINVSLELGVSSLIVIPEGFTENISAGLPGVVKSYTIIRSLAFSGIMSGASGERLIEAYSRILTVRIISTRIYDVTPDFVLNPIRASSMTIIKGRVIPISPSIIASVASQTITTPIMLTIMIIFAMQIAATSIAIEKEEKTLETLLSLPVSRFGILAGKLGGTIIIAVLGAAAFMVGYLVYANQIFVSYGEDMPQVSLESIGIGLTPQAFIVLGVVIFMALLSSLALSLSISVFAEDVRSAQTLVGYLYLPLMIPAFMLMMVDLNSLPLPIAIPLYLIPYTYVIQASKDLLLGEYTSSIIGIAYISLFTLAVLYFAARMFATEKILTARLRIFRRKTITPKT